MKEIIAQFFSSKKTAIKRVKELKKMCGYRIAWYVVCAKNGYFVISETQARLCFPNLQFSFKDRKKI